MMQSKSLWRGFVIVALALIGAQAYGQGTSAQMVSEGYPTELAQKLLEQRKAEIDAAAAAPTPALFSFVSTNYRWPTGTRLIVAFQGGSFPVWLEISKIANQWSKYANVTFDFGINQAAKTARIWKIGDPVSIAHVRIRLDAPRRDQRWSAVGQDTFNPLFAEGSMTLGGIANSYPMWTDEDRADILHEFGHVLGFLHEQQRDECQSDFRYVRGANGEPSIYDLYWKYFAWDHDKTEANLKLDAHYGQTSGSTEPDKTSLFLYPLYEFLLPATLHGKDGPCYVKNKNLTMSKNDIAKASEMYPRSAPSDALKASPVFSNIPTLRTVASALPSSALTQRIERIEHASRALVYIQIGSNNQRKNASEIQQVVRSNGFVAPGIENVGKSKSPKHPEIRFFLDSDESAARQVAGLVGGVVQDTVAVKQFKRLSSRIYRPTIEVWLPE